MAATGGLSQWLDAVLAGPIPEGVAAYCVNLYETSKGYEVELVGASEFDPEDSDWACSELFTSRDRNRFAISRATAGGDWAAALGYVQSTVAEYLAANGDGAKVLKSTQAVGVGFVDGDLTVLWRRA